MNIAFETANPRLQNILSRLKGVKKVGPNTYRAYSPLRDEKEPSLYITEKSDGTILMCDHGGGDTKATLAAIGLTMCILFPSGGSEGSGPKGPAPSRKVAAIYKYLDKNGELVAEKVRYTNKNFFWRSKKPDGSYDYHKPENVPLYNGMVLEKAEAVFLVEGEKDVDTLTKHGLPAVSLPNGAHWENEYVAYFSDKVIIILPDNDDAGRGYAKAALKALKFRCSQLDFCFFGKRRKPLVGFPLKSCIPHRILICSTAKEAILPFHIFKMFCLLRYHLRHTGGIQFHLL